MSRVGLVRFAIVLGLVLVLEIACRTGGISPTIVIPPSQMAMHLGALLASGKLNADIFETLGNVVVAVSLAIIGGFAIGSIIHAMPRVRRTLDPFLASYYALPFFAFYPVLIVLFGIGCAPIVVIGLLFGIVAMIIATLNGLDRIPRALIKTAKVYRMDPLSAALRIRLPSAAPHLFTGVKLAVAYSFIGVIAAEFIMSSSGLGYSIAYAFNNFENATMYALMLLIIVFVSTLNAILYSFEQRMLARQGR